MKRPDGHGRGGWSRDCGHPGPLRRPGLRFKLKPTATLNATQIARFPAKLPDRETNNLSGASAPPACAHRKSGITAQGERQRKEASTLVSFLPAGVLAPPRSCPRPERGGGRHRSWGVEVAAPPARGRGDLRTGRDPPRPRALSRAQGGHRTPRASGGGHQAGPRALALGAPSARHVLAKHLTLRAPEARCGSQVSITWTQLTATVPGSAGSVGSAGSAGSATPSQALGRSQVSTARFPLPSSSGTQTRDPARAPPAVAV